MDNDKLFKSRYIGVYKLGDGSKPWFTHMRFGNDSVLKVHSSTERIASIKYNLLARFFKGDCAQLNDILLTPKEHREIAKELFKQITTPTAQQKMLSAQGVKKIPTATSKFVGVYHYKKLSCNSYYAYICKEKRRYNLGYYPTEDIAGAVYNVAAGTLYFGTKKLNNVDMNILDDKLVKSVLAKIESQRLGSIREGKYGG